jgi:sec-independent protein translocase protein TatC
MNESTNEKMPLTAHLEELRTRLIRSLIAVGVCFLICYAFKEKLFWIVSRPLIDVLPQGSFMIFTGLPEAFFTYLKISFFAGLLLASPFVLYQIWKFISPGLYQKEKKYVVPFVITSTLLFVGGVCFAYFLVLPPAYKFFVDFSTDFFRPMFTLKEYLSLTLKLLLAFGIVFEIPVFLFFMTKIGLVDSRTLARKRKYAILIIFIAAAILTPTPDAFTQILMALPMMVLYEVGILVSKWGERKKQAASE